MPLPITDNNKLPGLRRYARPGSRVFRAYYAQQRRKDRKERNEQA